MRVAGLLLDEGRNAAQSFAISDLFGPLQPAATEEAGDPKRLIFRGLDNHNFGTRQYR